MFTVNDDSEELKSFSGHFAHASDSTPVDEQHIRGSFLMPECPCGASWCRSMQWGAFARRQKPHVNAVRRSIALV
jgi:hypothetical protein